MSASTLLLDTHAFLWWQGKPARLSARVRKAIATADVVYVSAASAWEAAIKAALGRLEIPETFEKGVRDADFLPLVITFAHAAEAARLPPHHADPFDRMLVAQARLEGLTLVTHDRRLEPYDVALMWT